MMYLPARSENFDNELIFNLLVYFQLTCFSFRVQGTTGAGIKFNRRALSYSGLGPPVSQEKCNSEDRPIIQSLPEIAYFYLTLPTIALSIA